MPRQEYRRNSLRICNKTSDKPFGAQRIYTALTADLNWGMNRGRIRIYSTSSVKSIRRKHGTPMTIFWMRIYRTTKVLKSNNPIGCLPVFFTCMIYMYTLYVYRVAWANVWLRIFFRYNYEMKNVSHFLSPSTVCLSACLCAYLSVPPSACLSDVLYILM